MTWRGQICIIIIIIIIIGLKFFVVNNKTQCLNLL